MSNTVVMMGDKETENSTPGVRGFRDLQVWKLGRRIVTSIYRVTTHFPNDELYGLTSQMRRAAVSIPSNVAEGFGRYHDGEYRQFVFTAMGSCAELETQVEVALDLGFLEHAEAESLLDDINHESKMLRNLAKKLAR